jgi:hypothetical protein
MGLANAKANNPRAYDLLRNLAIPLTLQAVSLPRKATALVKLGPHKNDASFFEFTTGVKLYLQECKYQKRSAIALAAGSVFSTVCWAIKKFLSSLGGRNQRLTIKVSQIRRLRSKLCSETVLWAADW